MKEESDGRFLNGFGIFGPSRIQPRSFKTKILLHVQMYSLIYRTLIFALPKPPVAKIRDADAGRQLKNGISSASQCILAMGRTQSPPCVQSFGLPPAPGELQRRTVSHLFHHWKCGSKSKLIFNCQLPTDAEIDRGAGSSRGGNETGPLLTSLFRRCRLPSRPPRRLFLVILPRFEPLARVKWRGARAKLFRAGGLDALYTHHLNCCTGCGGLALCLN